MKVLEQENRELWRGYDIMHKAFAYFPSGTQPPAQAIIGSIDEHQWSFGVEPISARSRRPIAQDAHVSTADARLSWSSVCVSLRSFRSNDMA